MGRIPENVIVNNESVQLFQGVHLLQEVVLTSVDDIGKFLSTDAAYSFRGQADASWLLKTTFERFVEEKKCRIANKIVERRIVELYQSEFSVFSNVLGYDPRGLSILDSLADIQHHGGPTRLLDWTSSFNIALFFAVFKNESSDAAVYCLRDIVFNAGTFCIREVLKGQLMNSRVEDTLPPALDKSRLLRWHVPSVKNNRIINQKGVFIYPHSIDVKFEEALSYVLDGIPLSYSATTKSSDPKLKELLLRSAFLKVVIPKHLLGSVRKYLTKSGISAKVIYPDFQGAIQSLYEVDTEFM